MATVLHEDAAAGSVRCPTCGAEQPWSDACRRCKCDLTLLRQVAEAWDETRLRCLGHLRAGRLGDALREAQHAYALCPDRHSARLLAVCHLLAGEWLAAMRMAEAAEEQA